MKTKKEIEKELEVRKERIKQIRTFGSESEINYERGCIDCLRSILENFKNLEMSNDRLRKQRIVFKLTTESPNDVNYD